VAGGDPNVRFFRAAGTLACLSGPTRKQVVGARHASGQSKRLQQQRVSDGATDERDGARDKRGEALERSWGYPRATRRPLSIEPGARIRPGDLSHMRAQPR
jgi:hypothetical protein